MIVRKNDTPKHYNLPKTKQKQKTYTLIWTWGKPLLFSPKGGVCMYVCMYVCMFDNLSIPLQSKRANHINQVRDESINWGRHPYFPAAAVEWAIQAKKTAMNK
jgi:hypothetical protein